MKIMVILESRKSRFRLKEFEYKLSKYFRLQLICYSLYPLEEIMNYDKDKVDEYTLALLYLVMF